MIKLKSDFIQTPIKSILNTNSSDRGLLLNVTAMELVITILLLTPTGWPQLRYIFKNLISLKIKISKKQLSFVLKLIKV